jgi:outer membrane receptor for ferrienterochelin and colicins
MYRTQAVRTLALIGLISLSAGTAAAQATGTVTGKVTSAETGQPLVNVQVQLIGGQAAQALTSQTGDFRLVVPTGTYAVVASSIGFAAERVDAVGVAAGQTRTVNFALKSVALQLNPIMVVASRREEKALDAPAAVTVIGQERIEERAASTAIELVKGVPGVDIIQTGVSQSNVVTRGFNNIFSGSLLVITDNRYASVPSLRLNAYNMIPLTSFDPERIEVLQGPASALYGPNSANGVLHIVTSSPIDRPGTAFSVAGGERDLFQGQFRHATRFSERFGLKVSGQYFKAADWEFVDPVEVTQKGLCAPASSDTCQRIGNRDYNNERWSGEARFDARPWENGEVILSAGINQLINSIELTGAGAGLASDWRYSYVQGRVRSGRLFAQGFINMSDAGESFLLRTGTPLIDKSRLLVGQIQHGFNAGERLDLIYGFDVQHTVPRTEGTITGANEDNDNIDEMGGYLHSTVTLTPKLDLIAALRADHHNRLEDVVFSPRAALVFRPADDQNLRFSFNRAFSTPTTNNLFLDLAVGRVGIPPESPLFYYNVRLRGVPETGFTFSPACAGGLNSLCMRSPLSPATQAIPANAAPFWNSLMQVAVLAYLPADRRAEVIAALTTGPAGDPSMRSIFRRFNYEAAQAGVRDPSVLFPVDAAGPTTIDRIRPTISNTFEAGYKGILGDRFMLAADVWQSEVTDFVGPLRVETPSLFFDPTTLGAFVASRLGPLAATGRVTPAQIQQLVAAVAGVPVGTVSPDQATSTDLFVTYRNYGKLTLKGFDAAFDFIATDQLSLTGSMSYVDHDCFDMNGDSKCASSDDISLNAPKVKGSAGARWTHAVKGITVDGRARFTDGFPENSGVYVGAVESYTVLDTNAAYRLPWVPGAQATLTVTNLLDNKHQESIGAPIIGRLAILRLTYQFR